MILFYVLLLYSQYIPVSIKIKGKFCKKKGKYFYQMTVTFKIEPQVFVWWTKENTAVMMNLGGYFNSDTTVK